MDVDALAAALIADEGLRLHAYRDTAGKLTIGIGHNLDELGITEAEARAILADDIARICADLDRSLPWWRGLGEARQEALAEMAFNLGPGGLLAFHNTLSALQDGRFEDAAREALNSRWAVQVGARAQRIAAKFRQG